MRAVKSGDLSVREVCLEFVQRIREAEREIQAFVSFDEEAVFNQADAVDARTHNHRLAGLLIGVKDNYDTVEFPTEYGSPIYRGNHPSRDSAVVARLKALGALLVGKTCTSEFAFMHNGCTRNPHGLTRTPGSSSAGSAAGMAAGFFPVALGTQTAGSLIKPASYCGAYAYKPTFGLVSLEGVKPLAPSLDTAGWFGRSVSDLQLMAEVLLGDELNLRSPVIPPLRLVAARTDFWNDADQASREVFENALEVLRGRGHLIHETAMPFDYRRLVAAHQVVMDREGSRSLVYECERHPELLSDAVLRMRERALELNYLAEATARDYIQRQADEMDSFMSSFDAILTLSTACEAPEGFETTGTSDFIRTWNALGMPQANLPIALGPHSMPIGLQLVGRRGEDGRLLNAAQNVSNDLGVKSCASISRRR
jgi:Asp-tRNA(Asn)/Glu-tRNA(Gln) amidotransferase A subunit family amidase